VTIEILLAVVPIFLAMFFATYVGQYMNRRAGLERVTFDALHRCSRGLSKEDARACVLETLSASATMCSTVNIEADVQSHRTQWEHEFLLDTVEKELSYITTDVNCNMQFDIPLVSAVFNMELELDAQTQAAMPLRLDTRLMP